MMKGGIAGLMQQAQKMQEKMQKAQEELARIEVEGQAGAGMVKVTMTGKHVVKRVQIDPRLLAEDRDMLGLRYVFLRLFICGIEFVLVIRLRKIGWQLTE